MAYANKYVPYGINGVYYVYDNEQGCIPMGWGHRGDKKKIIAVVCDLLNKAGEKTIVQYLLEEHGQDQA